MNFLEKEVIFKADLEKIFGTRKWKSFEEEELLKLRKRSLRKSKKNDKIFSTENPNTAEITKQMLEENDINVVLLNKQDSSYLMFGLIDIYVNEKQVEKAKNLLNDIQMKEVLRKDLGIIYITILWIGTTPSKFSFHLLFLY